MFGKRMSAEQKLEKIRDGIFELNKAVEAVNNLTGYLDLLGVHVSLHTDTRSVEYNSGYPREVKLGLVAEIGTAHLNLN